jgi:hypothetical protein
MGNLVKQARAALLVISLAVAACDGGGSDAGACPFPGNCPGSTARPNTGGGAAATPGVLQSGTGAFVFTVPTDVSVVRIQGATTSASENFAVRANGRLIVNQVIGTRSTPRGHDGTYSVTAGATLEIFHANNVNWSVSGTSSTPASPGVFDQQGTGAGVFELPQRTARYAVRATNAGASENFAVRVADRLIVNAIIGTGSNPAAFDGIYLLVGGRVEVLTGPGVVWSFSERP